MFIENPNCEGNLSRIKKHQVQDQNQGSWFDEFAIKLFAPSWLMPQVEVHQAPVNNNNRYFLCTPAAQATTNVQLG